MIQKVKHKLSEDKHFIELLKGSSISFVFKIVGMGFGYLFTLFIARWYGAETMGLYTLSLTMLNIFVTIGVFGFDNALVKFVAEYNSQAKLYLIKEVYIKVLSVVIPIGMVLSVMLYFGADLFARDIFKKEHLSAFLQITAMAVLPFVLLRVNATFFRGLKKIKLFAFFDSLGVMLLSFIGLIIVARIFHIMDNYVVIDVQVFSIVFLMLVSFINVKKYTNILNIASKNMLKYRNILTVSFPMLLTSSMALVMGWTDMVMLGMFRSEAEVGVYSVVVKLAGLTSIALIGINSIAAPKFSEFYSSGNKEGLRNIAQSSTKMIFFSSIPIISILILFPKQILGMFGSEFTVGYMALWILMIGQIINSVTGSVGYILIMTGKEKLFQNIIIFTGILNIALNYILVEKYGLNGVAFSTAISLSVQNIISFFYVKYYYGFYTFNWKRSG
ncbi:MAG: flippase [Candidatus Gracilibacteria bacterium]